MRKLIIFFFRRYSHPYFIAKNVIEIPVLGISDYSLIYSIKGPRYKPHQSVKIGQIWLENLKCLDKGLIVIQAQPGGLSPDYVNGLEFFIDNAIKMGVKFETLKSLTNDFLNKQSNFSLRI